MDDVWTCPRCGKGRPTDFTASKEFVDQTPTFNVQSSPRKFGARRLEFQSERLRCLRQLQKQPSSLAELSIWALHIC